MTDLHTEATKLMQELDPILGSGLQCRYDSIYESLGQCFGVTLLFSSLSMFWALAMTQISEPSFFEVFSLCGLITFSILLGVGGIILYNKRKRIRFLLYMQQHTHAAVRNEYEVFELLYETLTTGLMTGTRMLRMEVARGSEPPTTDLEYAELTRLQACANELQRRMPSLQTWAKDHAQQVAWAATV